MVQTVGAFFVVLAAIAVVALVLAATIGPRILDAINLLP